MTRRSTISVAAARWVEIDAGDERAAEPRYALGAVAARCGVHPRTLRRYEQLGLIEPAGDGPGRYSDLDVARVRRIRRLVNDLGVNLAGVAAILHLCEQVLVLQGELRVQRDGEPGD